MKKIRLKPTCKTPKVNTPYGLVTHEWRTVNDDAYVYNEMEVFGEEPVVKGKPEAEPEPEKASVASKPEAKPKTKKKQKGISLKTSKSSRASARKGLRT